MRVIFLDFDGVLNRGSGAFLVALVDRLNRITAKSGTVIVVHSSWRHSRTVKTLRAILQGFGVTGEVVGKCDSPVYEQQEDGMLVECCDWENWTEGFDSNDERAVAIQRWLRDHPDVEKYVILDDCGGFTELADHFVQTQMNVGLTDDHVRQALELLA